MGDEQEARGTLAKLNDALKTLPIYGEIEDRRKAEVQAVARIKILREMEDAYELSLNPVYVWAAISTCCKVGLLFPDFVMKYLGSTASKVVSALEEPPADIGRALPTIFGFVGERLTGRGSPFSMLAKMSRDQRLAMAFADEILSDCDPAEARIIAVNALVGDDASEDEADAAPDDRTVQRAIDAVFSPPANLRKKDDWAEFLLRWFLKNEAFLPFSRHRVALLKMICNREIAAMTETRE